MTARERRYHAWKKALKDQDEFRDHWMCGCGHYIENGMHCPVCKSEPPWGCPGECCQSSGWDDESEPIDYPYYGDACPID